jgi:hypothetical protein
MEFEFDLGGSRKGRERDDSKPMRLLVIGDFSGSPVAERPPLASRPTHKVDLDTLDVVLMHASGTRLRMPARRDRLSQDRRFSSGRTLQPASGSSRSCVRPAPIRLRTTPRPGTTMSAACWVRLRKSSAAPAAPAATRRKRHRCADSQRGRAAHREGQPRRKRSPYLAAVDAAIAAEMRTLSP